MNEGRCVALSATEYTCECYQGYTGINCEERNSKIHSYNYINTSKEMFTNVLYMANMTEVGFPTVYQCLS